MSSFYSLGQTYCTTRFNSSDSHRINRVRLQSTLGGANLINNTSNSTSVTSSGYSDFSAQSAAVSPTASYTLTVSVSRVFSIPNGYQLFVDYNNDGDFDDVNELVQTIGVNNGTNQVFTFTIPAGVTFGPKRMRVNMVNTYNAGACTQDFSNFGEAEDYTLRVEPPLPLAVDDNLTVLFNSTAGASNTVNARTNDFIGTMHGTDGNDYALSTFPLPLTTANGGTVTESTTNDGSFIYVPAAGFIGLDSFNYTM